MLCRLDGFVIHVFSICNVKIFSNPYSGMSQSLNLAGQTKDHGVSQKSLHWNQWFGLVICEAVAGRFEHCRISFLRC